MVAILLLAAAMRLYLLTADAPIYLTRSQELNTDGPNTIGFARDWVLFGSRPPSHIQPALSWLAYFSFSLLGIGYWQANVIAVVSGILAIVFIAAFAQQHFGRRIALFSALLMALNFPYLIYNRTPMVYTPLTCGLALALYCWGRGLRRPIWFFLSGLMTLFSVFFIKVAGVTFLAAAVAALLILAWRHWQREESGAYSPLIWFTAGGVLIAIVAWFYIYSITPVQIILPSDVSTRTFNTAHGLEENIRFAVVSVLQFGIYSGFFTRLFLFFAVVYGYLFCRAAQLLGENRPALKMSEVITLLYLASTLLMLLASNTLPFRFMIMLIPPMSLIAGLALNTWLHLQRVSLPTRFGRFQLIFILIGLTYFVYQFLAAGLKLDHALRLDTGLVDYRVIIELGTLYVLLIISLLLVVAGILTYIWWVGRVKQAELRLPSSAARRWIALGVVVGILGGDLYQYWAWAKDPHFSIIEASHQISQDLGQEAVLGGAYAYVLALENEIPAVTFYTYNTNIPPQTLDSKITHLAVDADSLLKDAPFNEEGLYKIYPETMKRAKLLKTYLLRGYLVKLYEIKP